MKRMITCSSATRPKKMPQYVPSLFPIVGLEERFNDGEDDPYTDEFFIDLFSTPSDYAKWIENDFGRDGGPYPQESINQEFTSDGLDRALEAACKQNPTCAVVYVEEAGDGVGQAFYNPYAKITSSTAIKAASGGFITPIRIPDGENFNDVALGSRIGKKIWDNYMQEDWEAMIEEAADYYANSGFHRKHDAQRIIDKAYDEIEMEKEYEEEQAERQKNAPDYCVYVYEPGREDQQGIQLDTSDIEEAVETWFQWSSKYPTCVAIDAKNKDKAMDLLKACNANEEGLRELASRYRCPYKIDFIIEEIDKKVNGGYPITGFYGGYPDQVYPFALG